MSKRCRYTADEKYQILKAYEDGVGSLAEIASMYQIGIQTIYDWRYIYNKYGIEGLKESKVCKHYSKELKELAVRDYLSGNYSQRQLLQKYEISSTSVLNKWINRHTGHRGIDATEKGMNRSMAMGRSTSLKERIEIANYCIALNNDYNNAAQTYRVSYQQVYQWVKKYELGGEDALKDGRGRKKTEEELSDEDRVTLAMKKLEVENERLKAENAFLKKLGELERGLR